jgi:hypothetical protein
MLYVYFCDACRAETVSFADDGNYFSHSLYTVINDRMYRWTTFKGTIAGVLSHIGKPGIPGERPNGSVTNLLELKIYPNITPENVQEKIRFMLLFL